MLQVMIENKESRAFLGFGGNLGNLLVNFRQSKQQLVEHPQIKLLSSSPLYRTPPVGGPEGQPDYLNGSIEILTRLSPLDLLKHCCLIENEYGRERDQHWGARTLDIDLLLIEDIIVDVPLLTLPHPRLHLRHFVLLPLNDLAPTLNHPVLNETINGLLHLLPAEDGITQLNEIW